MRVSRIALVVRLFSVQPRNAPQNLRARSGKVCVVSLLDQLKLNDAHARLVAQLTQLDSLYHRASTRERCSGSYTYADPDGQTMLKALAEGRALIREYHAARASSVADIGALDRAAAIAELRAVLAVWEDYEHVSDAQWLASRGVRAPAPTVVRRKRAAP